MTEELVKKALEAAKKMCSFMFPKGMKKYGVKLY